MILNNKSAEERLNSPLNLINRLKNSSSNNGRKNAMSLFIRPLEEKNEKKSSFNPFESSLITKELVPTPEIPENLSNPTIDNLIENSDAKIKLELAHDNALKLLNDSVAMLQIKLEDVKAEKLPAVISASSKVVESIRRERLESAKSGINKEVHYHFYTPTQKKITDYEVIDAVPA